MNRKMLKEIISNMDMDVVNGMERGQSFAFN